MGSLLIHSKKLPWAMCSKLRIYSSSSAASSAHPGTGDQQTLSEAAQGMASQRNSHMRKSKGVEDKSSKAAMALHSPVHKS